MNEPTYVPVKVTKDFKVTAVETTYKAHKNTNMILEVTEKTVLDEVKFPATTETLAIYYAMKKIDEAGKVDMTSLVVTARPFPG